MMCSSCVDECNEACDDCDEEFPWDFDDAEVGARPDASAPPARARAGRVAATEDDEDNDDDYVPSEADDEEEPNSADEYSPVYAKAAQTASSTSGGAAAIAPAAAVAPAAGSGGGDVKDALGELDELQEELDWIRSTLAPTNASGWLDRPVLRRGRRSVQLRSDLMDAHFILYDLDGSRMVRRNGMRTDKECAAVFPSPAFSGRPRCSGQPTAIGWRRATLAKCWMRRRCVPRRGATPRTLASARHSSGTGRRTCSG